MGSANAIPVPPRQPLGLDEPVEVLDGFDSVDVVGHLSVARIV